jgi:hypothetical protein
MQVMAEAKTENGDARDYSYGQTPNNRHTWDHDQVQGCICDPGFRGYSCEERKCPIGDDHRIVGGNFERQTFVCSATTGEFSLRFRQHQTPMMDYQISAANLKIELEKLPSIGVVDVVYYKMRDSQALLDGDQFKTGLWIDDQNTSKVDGVDTNHDGIADIRADLLAPCVEKPCVNFDAACDEAGSNEVAITFRTELGDLPPITAHYEENRGIGSIMINQDGQANSVKGSKSGSECSGRGLCNIDTGQCACFPGYGSSDGSGGPGDRGDCGYKEPISPLAAR